MADYDEDFLNVFNEYYPFERYIFKDPKPLGMTFDDVLLTEFFCPYTKIKPVLDENNKLLYFTSIPYNEVYVKVVGNAGEMRIGYLDFEEHIRTMIRCNFIEDFGGYEYEGLYVDHDDEGDDNASLIAVLKNQKALIEEKYGECNIKPSVRSNLVNECNMVTLKILDEEFDKKIENISLACAFSMIEDYCIEHMIDEPKVSDVLYDVDRMVVYLDNVTFEIEDCY